MGVLKIGILGSGVVGLNMALELQKEYPTANISIIAEKFGSDTTSEVAAGIFHPSNSFTGTTPQITNQWLRDAFSYYRELQQSSEGFDAGLTEISGYFFSTYDKDMVRSPFLEGLVPVYRAATREELDSYPGEWKYGSYFTTLVTECTKFLPWAMNKFKMNGGHICEQKINSFGDVANDFDVVFNCLGLGAKHFCNDNILVPIRGQIIRVQAPWMKPFFFGDDDTYIIPRSDSVILGGCFNYDNYNLKVNKHDTASIKERCYKIVPKLAEAPIIKEWVGLRPHRTPVRVETEIVRAGTKHLKVVHNYGHGGYGVTTAPGTAKYAAKLFKDMHSASLGNSKY